MSSAPSGSYNVAVLGLGGVGGYLGGLLALSLAVPSASDVRLFFLARGGHLDRIRERGLILNTPEAPGHVCRPTLATSDPGDLPVLDLALVCVKSYSLQPLLAAVASRLGPQTAILPLLNGLDIGERIRGVVFQGVVLRACIYVSAHLDGPGVVTREGGPGDIFFGPDPAHPEFSPEKILDLFGRAGMACSWQPDPEPALWEKYFFVAAFGLVTAFSREGIGEVAHDPELLALTRGVMREISALASKQGVRLAPGLMETTLEKARSLPPGMKTSYQRDLEVAGHPSEGDLFGGTILRLGQRFGIETPVTRSLYQTLLGRQAG